MKSRVKGLNSSRNWGQLNGENQNAHEEQEARELYFWKVGIAISSGSPGHNISASL